MTAPKSILLALLVCCMHFVKLAHSFTNTFTSCPPLKGSSSQTLASPTLTRLRVTEAEAEATAYKKTSQKQRQKYESKQSYKTEAKHTSKKRGAAFGHLRVFNSKLTQCNSASELLACFMDQTSAKGYAERYNDVQSTPLTSAATHLAGATKANSVNFSTCLHRLARFASNTHHNEECDERKQTLSDPRFALLLCSVAEMGARADPNLSVLEGKAILDQWELDSMMDIDEGMRVADDVLSDIVGMIPGADSSTSDGVLSGRYDNSGSVGDIERRQEVAKEAMRRLAARNKMCAFSSRECSNISWALAKIRVAPPSNAFPLGRVAGMDDCHEDYDKDRRLFQSLDEMSLDILSSTLKVRTQLLEEARKRKTGAIGSSGTWIPELSRLAGKLMDLFAVQIIQEYASRRRADENSAIDEFNADSSNGGKKTGNRAQVSFNPQEMASALWAFAKSQRADSTLFSAVAQELIRQTELMKKEGGMKPKPQEFSNTLWAFATAGIRGDAQVSLTKLMADAMDDGGGQFFGGYFKPQEFSNSAWALATLHSKRTHTDSNLDVVEDDAVVRILRWVAKNIQQRVDEYKPQELSNTVWACATLGFGYDESSGTNAHNDYVHVASDSPMEDKELMYDTLETIAENALSRLEKFKAQELNNLAWGFARLGHRTLQADKLFKGIAGELSQRVHQFKPQDVGTTLWSLATVECHDSEAFRAGASRLNFQQIRLFKPQEMSNAVWALATAGFAPKYTHAFDTTLVPSNQRPSMSDIKKDPFTECFAAVAGELMRRPQEFKDQELKDVLWAFSKIGIRHPSLFKRIAERIVGPNGRTFSTFSPQGIGNTVWSYARQAQLSLDVIDTLGLGNVKVGTTGRLAVYETSCLDVGEDLIKLLFVKAAEAGIDMGLDRFKTQDLSNTCWAYSTLGLLHCGFFQEVERQIMTRLRHTLCGQEIANILWAFATLNAQPNPAMVDTLSSHIYALCRGKRVTPNEVSISRIFKRQEIANVAWSCAVLGSYPEPLMKTLYQGMFGTQNDPEFMKKTFGDTGLQKSSIMTMYYVQYAADVEAPHLKLSLPKGFPNGWGEDDFNLSAKCMEDDQKQTSSSMLQLTVSKLQREVSETMTQIGFDNVLEYVIDTPSKRDINNDDPNELPENPDEFLSIDIANAETRLGVEVDGPGHFVRLIDLAKKSHSNDDVHGQQFADRGNNRVNGPTLLKHRLLSALGWNIIHIPYWEYQNLGGDNDKEIAYCEDVLGRFSCFQKKNP